VRQAHPHLGSERVTRLCSLTVHHNVAGAPEHGAGVSATEAARDRTTVHRETEKYALQAV
jgi:hypothetical protein